jgi:hypothetical protein
MREPCPEYTPDYALWHNGIIKANVVERLAQETGTKWDTGQILSKIAASGQVPGQMWWECLNEFDGSFSCLMYSRGKGLYMFRNQISPMFMDTNLNISSTKFEGSFHTDPDIVWKMNPLEVKITEIGRFKTVENPYYFGE